LSSVCSAKIFLSRAFSRSSSFSRLAWSNRSPPYSFRQLMGWTAPARTLEVRYGRSWATRKEGDLDGDQDRWNRPRKERV
jgi:hypothetical protein